MVYLPSRFECLKTTLVAWQHWAPQSLHGWPGLTSSYLDFLSSGVT